jgi:hypothetical protein
MAEPGNDLRTDNAAPSSASSSSGIESSERPASTAGPSEVGTPHTESIANETKRDAQQPGQQTGVEDFSGRQKRLDDFSWWKGSPEPESDAPQGVSDETASDAEGKGQQKHLDDYSSKGASTETSATLPNQTPDSVKEGTADPFLSGFEKGLGDVEKIYTGALRRDAKTFYEGWKGVADEFGTFIESARHQQEPLLEKNDLGKNPRGSDEKDETS